MTVERRQASVSGKHLNIREMALELGIPRAMVDFVTPYMHFLPRSTDGRHQAIQLIVQGIQRRLNELGYRVRPDGHFGPETARGVMLVSGPGWARKTWMQIIGDVMSAERLGRESPERPVREPLDGVVADVLWSPIGLVAAGLGAWYVMRRFG